MKKAILIILLLTPCWILFSQIKIDKKIYKLKFSNTLHQPTYVSYFLYKGGGDCNREREAFLFKNDESNLECATDTDYEKSGYDKGHLANAEDFAFSCEKEELTFRYYNCLPQTHNLNRGVWKKIETKVREWSQKEKLYIICGGFFGSKKIGKAVVPNYCWKVVQSVTTKKILFCGWFSNTDKAKLDTLSVNELENKLNSKLTLCN